MWFRERKASQDCDDTREQIALKARPLLGHGLAGGTLRQA